MLLCPHQIAWWILDGGWMLFTETDCVLSSPTGDVPLSVSWLCLHVTFSPLLIMSWPRHSPALVTSDVSGPGWGNVASFDREKIWKTKKKNVRLANQRIWCKGPTYCTVNVISTMFSLWDGHEWWGGESTLQVVWLPNITALVQTGWAGRGLDTGHWTLGAVEDIFCEWLQWLSPVTSPGCRGSHPQSPVCCRSWNWTWGRHNRQS